MSIRNLQRKLNRQANALRLQAKVDEIVKEAIALGVDPLQLLKEREAK